MIAIGLIGAPGSGKTQLANDLADSNGSALIVDDYAAAVEERSGIALDKYATYMGNMMVAFERVALEEHARFQEKQPELMITCGTLIESCAYTAFNVGDDGNDPIQMAKVQGALAMLGCLMLDTFSYDLLIWLRPIGEDEFAHTIDAEIPKVLSTTGLSPFVLDQDRWARLESAKERLQEITVVL